MKEKPRIIFFGTPEFAVRSLEIIVHSGYPVVAVVTAPDKPAGRGLKMKTSPVKQFALQHNLPVLQPLNLKDPRFHELLQSFAPDLQVIVAFRMLPKEVWSLPAHGTFNLHASLLPQYRGAAPINWVLINGETETGVTTFFLDEAIDTGNIVFAEKMMISENETAGELHDRLMVTGANLVLRTIEAVESGNLSVISQKELIEPGRALHKSPKILREDCRINWNQDVLTIHHLIRGLSPHPGAFAELCDKNNNTMSLKVYRAEPEIGETLMNPGAVVTNGKSHLKVAGLNGFIWLKEVQMTGHKVMAIADFLNGFGKYFA